ncbi:MAG: MFS transporter, partial [Desulfovibrionaceae bacterium]|nr:MFS transporter [Desulfovibrionaceae bacterium]
MEDRNQASRQVAMISLITAACLIGDSMLYIVLPVHFAAAGLDSLWEVGIILSANRLVRLPLNPAVGWLYQRISDRTGIFIAT